MNREQNYHLTLVEALARLDGISESPWWATASMARLCQQTGKPVCDLTVADLQRAWASSDKQRPGAVA
jgi:hypothetical protein